MDRYVPKGNQAALARFNQLGVERLTSDISKAIGHSNSRNSHVVQATCFFSLIRSTSSSVAAARVMIEVAQRQMFRSVGGYQAAHYLPGQIKINDQLPWFLLSNAAARQRLEDLFANVEHLPAAFNKADSAAESKGLREAFRAAGEVILHDPTPPIKGVLNRSLIRRIYDDVWIPQASKSFGDAIVQKMAVSEVPRLEIDDQGNLNLENISERSTADWSREDEISILQRYSESLRTLPPDLRDDKILEIERIAKD